MTNHNQQKPEDNIFPNLGTMLRYDATKIEASPNFYEISSKGDCIELLKLIKNTTFNYQSQ